jgi:pyruvate ferredoxin oxidoreductase gamma subunit
MTKEDKTIEIRWHGRGGQGAVTSAEMVALAAIDEGKYAQAFPSFGPERRGAPVLAFNRISIDSPIRIRAAVNDPDVIVVLDPGLLSIIDVTQGLKSNGIIVINTQKSIKEIEQEIDVKAKYAVVNATAIAREMIGVPIVNTTMLGALVKATGVIDLKSLEEPIKERFGARADNNIGAAAKAFEQTVIEEFSAVKGIKKEFKGEVLPTAKELLPGCVVTEPGSAKQYRTGDWKSQHPVWDHSKCIKCGICYLFCPEACIHENSEGYFEGDMYYCKGCGICAHECWTGAISIVEEM